MAKMVSIQHMVERVRSLKPHDLSNWEQHFRESIERAALADRIEDLSDVQLDKLQQIYEKHFTG
jgi:hypothetical protein